MSAGAARGTRAARWVATLALGALIFGAMTACSAGDPAGNTEAETSPPATSALSGSITVFAAASLTATFTTLADDFESENPGTTVELSFAGSSDLVTQILNGAPADVVASADTKNMAKLSDASLLARKPADFATNMLEIAVPPGNPASIETFADLAKPGVKTVVCAPQVPCGAAAVAVEAATGVTLAPVSEESSVTDVLGKVQSGEADAGLVYLTDVASAGDKVVGIPFDEAGAAVNTYPIATVKGTANLAAATAFVEYVTGTAGREVLRAAGFGAP